MLRSDWRITLFKFFIISNVIDAAGTLKIKYISSLLLLLTIFMRKKIKLGIYEFILLVLFPMVAVPYSYFICDVSLGAAISAVTFCLGIIYYIAIINEKKITDGMLMFFVNFMTGLSYIILMIFVIALILQITGNQSYYWTVGGYLQHKLKLGFFGYNYIGSIYMPIVYFKSSMFLIFAFAGACFYEKRKSIIILFLANMLVSTTANIVFTVPILIYYFIKKIKPRMKSKYVFSFFLLGSSIMGIMILFFDKLYEKLYGFISDMTLQSSSSMVKIGHITSILEVLLNDVKSLLFGMGGGSSFYSSYLQYKVVNSEVSQLECLRRFGIIFTSIFFLYIFLIIYSLYKTNKKILACGLLMLFLATASNPQLLSPMFLIILAMCKEVKTKKQNRVGIKWGGSFYG